MIGINERISKTIFYVFEILFIYDEEEISFKSLCIVLKTTNIKFNFANGYNLFQCINLATCGQHMIQSIKHSPAVDIHPGKDNQSGLNGIL